MRRFIVFLLAALLLAAPLAAQTIPQVKVITTFSVLGDITRQVGGEYVLVGAFAAPNQDIEKYQPKADDTKAIEVADLVIANGLDLEKLWLPYLIRSTKAEEKLVIASKGITPITVKNDKGEDLPDPHAWHSIPNVIKYVATIRDALVAKDPLHADNYKANAEKYTRELYALDAWVKAKIGLIAAEDRSIILNRDVMAYFAREYEIKITSMAELGKAGTLLPKAFFLDNVAEAKNMRSLQNKSMAFGGKLYTNSLANQPPADTYVGMIRWNTAAITDTILKPRPAQ